MASAFFLHIVDWLIIGFYLILALGVGFVMKKRDSTERTSYFLAERSLPWWWVGASMAATTFAADTPLAVTGLTLAFVFAITRNISGRTQLN